MSSGPSSPNPNESPPPQPGRRRSSFVDIFSRPAGAGGTGTTPTSNPTFPTRRLSITTLGLSALPGNQTTPFGSGRTRRESDSSNNSGSVDESPFEEETPTGTSVPTTPFARRMSFGARALRDVRAGSGNANANGRPSVSSAVNKSPPTSKGREGFDFAENLRARAERSSISAGSTMQMSPQMQQRSKSIAIPETQKPERPKAKAPDAFQERILKGDFYMD